MYVAALMVHDSRGEVPGAAVLPKRFAATVITLGRRYTESRDPDDKLLLPTATRGRAAYLFTNDRDLLDLPRSFRRTLTTLASVGRWRRKFGASVKPLPASTKRA